MPSMWQATSNALDGQQRQHAPAAIAAGTPAQALREHDQLPGVNPNVNSPFPSEFAEAAAQG